MRPDMMKILGRAGAGMVLLLLAMALWIGGTRAMPQDDNHFCVRAVEHSPLLGNEPAVELEVRSARPFPAQGLLPVLRIGSQRFQLGRYPPEGDFHTLVFTLTPEEFAQVREGEPVLVQYGEGAGAAGRTWDFGPLEKTRACTD